MTVADFIRTLIGDSDKQVFKDDIALLALSPVKHLTETVTSLDGKTFDLSHRFIVEGSVITDIYSALDGGSNPLLFTVDIETGCVTFPQFIGPRVTFAYKFQDVYECAGLALMQEATSHALLDFAWNLQGKSVDKGPMRERIMLQAQAYLAQAVPVFGHAGRCWGLN
jgi:hypothetical protein